MTWADAVLRLLLSRRNRDAVSGDLLETYREEILPSRSPFRARLWYWRQVAGFVSPAMLGVAMGSALGVMILIDTAGFHSLRADANYEYLRGTPLIVGIGAAAGAVSGTIGATAALALQRKRTRVST